MQFEKAYKIANEVVSIISPHCEKIDIAGSIRRKKPLVKDIEIVCLPKVTVLKDLFGRDEGIIVDSEFQKKIQELGEVIKGQADGKYIQIKLPQGIMLDLFMPDDFDYYRQLAIRTGSADYSFKVIAAGWRRLGWCGSDKGLRKMSDCIETRTPDGKSKWQCIVKNPELPPAWKSEEEFFDWIGVKMIEPELR